MEESENQRQIKMKSQEQLTVRFHRHGRPPLCHILCERLGLAKVTEMFVKLGLIEERVMKIDVHCKLAKNLRDAMPIQYSPHIFFPL